MSFLENALRLLSRPTEGKPREASKTRKLEADDAAPLTQAELIEALTQLLAEREAALATLAGAAEKRETLLMQPGSDPAILGLQASIDIAQLTLERVDRLEPDLRAKLARVQMRDENLRWMAYRDEVAPALAEFGAAIDDYRAAREKWIDVYNRVAAAWPNAKAILPLMPELGTSPWAANLPNARRGTYAEQLEKFRQLEIVEAPWVRAQLASLGAAIKFTQQRGYPPPDVSGEWREKCLRAIDPAGVKVVLTVNRLGPDGNLLRKGTHLRLPYEEAAYMVQTGKADYEFSEERS